MRNIFFHGRGKVGFNAEQIGFAILLVLSVVQPCVGADKVADKAAKTKIGKLAVANAPAEIEGPYCGLYSLYGALSAVGKDVDFASLLDPKYISSWQGSAIEELRQAAEDHATHAEILTGLGADSLRTAKHPMILRVASEGQLKEYNHWVLFLEMEKGKARIMVHCS